MIKDIDVNQIVFMVCFALEDLDLSKPGRIYEVAPLLNRYHSVKGYHF